MPTVTTSTSTAADGPASLPEEASLGATPTFQVYPCSKALRHSRRMWHV